MLKQVIEQRRIPPLPEIEEHNERREYMLGVLSREEYGRELPKPDKISFSSKMLEGENYMAGKARLDEITVTVELYGKSFSFPFKFLYRVNEKNQKVIVHINFRDAIPDKYTPAEEIIDRGFAVAQFCYNDVTEDNVDFSDRLSGLLFPEGERKMSDDAGKLKIWAWAASRVADYLETLDFVDADNLAVAGHSRLGKTALVAGAYDERFKFVHSNDSGCGGGAIFRDKRGETAEDISHLTGGRWFCPNFEQYRNNEHSMPFDQHWLLACIAPRYVELATAVEDVWADHESEYLSCVLAGAEYERRGLSGFPHPDRYPETGESFAEGHISYYVREGRHYFSRYDWNKLMDFISAKLK